MSSDKLQLLSPLFLKYQTEYEKNPRSRVFAPLAETYRKLGMTEKAMEILSQGIRFHPTYVMGYLGLAFCYFDIRQFNLAYSTLRPLVESNRDNIRLQKLFADVCLELGQKEEALETFKYLLFINPRDKEVAAQVSALESVIENQYRPVHKPIYIAESELDGSHYKKDFQQENILFDIDKLDNRQQPVQKDFDDWMALDLSKETPAAQTKDEQYDFWNLKKNNNPIISKKEEPASERNFKVKLDLDGAETTSEPLPEKSADAPLVTHTLVDLYCGQGHIEKALEVLEKILSLNPNDQKTINKIAEIKALMGSESEAEPQSAPVEMAMDAYEPFEYVEQHPEVKSNNDTISEEAGRLHLMSLIDETLGNEKNEVNLAKEDDSGEKVKALEQKLTLFLQRIHKRALDYQSRV